MTDLEDENRRLREYIDACKDCQAAEQLIELEDIYNELRSRCSEFMERLKAGMQVRVGSCPWCGDVWPNPENDLARVRAIAMAHDTECKENPIRLERDKLREQVRELSK